MDEDEYKEIYRSVNELRCAFEKAVLTRTFGCAKLTKINIAEREAAGCSDIIAQRRCLRLLDEMRRNAAFALKLTRATGPLPHGKEIKVQCGGLMGLQDALENVTPPKQGGVSDIHALVEQATEQYGEVERLPFPRIVQAVAHYQGRSRRRRR